MSFKNTNSSFIQKTLKSLVRGILLAIFTLTVSTPAFAGRAEAEQYLNERLEGFSQNDQSSFYACSFGFLPTSDPLGAYGYNPTTAGQLKSELTQIFWNGIENFKSQALDRQALPGYFENEVRTTALKTPPYSCSGDRNNKDHVQGLVDEMNWLFKDTLTLYFTYSAVVAKFSPSHSKITATALTKPTPQECFEADLEDLMGPSGSLHSCYCLATFGGGCHEITGLRDDLHQALANAFGQNGTLNDSQRNSWFEAGAKSELNQKAAPTFQNDKYSCSDLGTALKDVMTKFNECAIPLTPASTPTGGNNWTPPVGHNTGEMPNGVMANASSPIGNTPVGNTSDPSNGLSNREASSSGCSIGFTTNTPGTSLAFAFFLLPFIIFVGLRKSLISQEELANWLRDLA